MEVKQRVGKVPVSRDDDDRLLGHGSCRVGHGPVFLWVTNTHCLLRVQSLLLVP